jgi:beta-lactamase regulating signal transducer with metallopeptidase domain/biopolymer transport protein ExbD
MIELLNEWGEIWVDYFGLAVVQNTVFLGFVFVALHIARSAPARIKYIIAMTGLVKLLMPPFIPLNLELAATADIPMITNIVHLAPSASVPHASDLEMLAGPHARLSIGGFLLAAWVLSAFFWLVLSLVATIRLRCLLRSAEAISPSIAMPGAEAGLVVYKSDRISVPLTAGLFSRRIYVPSRWDCWTEACRCTVIQHELAHVGRRDGIFLVLQILVRAIYFFHPLAWLICRRLTEYREMACDDRSVAKAAVSPVEYSRRLVEIAESISHDGGRFRAAVTFLAGENELIKRIQYQIMEGKMRAVPSKLGRLMLVGLILLILPLSWYCGEARPGVEQESCEAAVSSGLPEWIETIEVAICCYKIKVDGKPVALDDLRTTLREKAADDVEHTVILLKLHRETTMGEVYDVRRVLVDLDLLKVLFVGTGGNEFALRLPSKEDAERLEDLDENLVAVVGLDSAGKITVNGEEVPADRYKARVVLELVKSEWAVFSIQAAREVTSEDFLKVLNETKGAGALRISIDEPL